MKEKKTRKIKFPVVLIPVIAIAIAVPVILLTRKKLTKTEVPEELVYKKETISQLKESKEDKEKRVERLNTTDEYKAYEKLSDEEKSKVEVIPRQEKLEFEELEVVKEDQRKYIGKAYVEAGTEQPASISNVEVLPEKFNLADLIDIKVENQDQFGLCWDFASLNSLETNLALTQGVNCNFSESYIDYMTSKLINNSIGVANGGGGNFQRLLKYNLLDKGYALEEDVPLNVYDDYEYNTFYNVPTQSYMITKITLLPNPRAAGNTDVEKKIQETREAIKTHVMNYGSMTTSLKGNNYYMNQYTKSKDEINPSEGGHVVSIVGWDDNYSKDNFTSPKGYKPENDGAFIVLNSWGENWGYNGYFYISYEDAFVYDEVYGVVSVNNWDDLINLDTLSNKKVAEYLKENMRDSIITKDGVEYLNLASGNRMFRLDFSNMDIYDINEVIDLIKYFHPSTINLSNNHLQNIDGLEKYLNSSYMDINLSNNSIKELPENFKNIRGIYSLNLSNNPGIKGYEGCTDVAELDISGCGVSDISFLENYSRLYSLNISNNPIENYESLSKLENLRRIEVASNNIYSLDIIKSIIDNDKINYLNLSNNDLKSLSGLEKTKVYILDLSNNQHIENYAPIRSISTLTEINLTNCNITDAKDIYIEAMKDVSIQYAGTEYEDVSGVTYILSNNKEITNLGALANACNIELVDCDLKDVSELKNLEYLRVVDLSSNKDLRGDLSGKSYSIMKLNDCNLNNDFNLFNVELVNELYAFNNQITNYEKIRHQVGTVKIDEESYSNVINPKYSNVVFVRFNEYGEDRIYSIADSRQVTIPNTDGLKVYVPVLIKQYKAGADLKINDKFIKFDDIFVDIDTTSRIMYRDYMGVHEITFTANQNARPEGLIVTKRPDNLTYSIENIDTSGIEVAEIYSGFIYKKIDDFEIDTEITEIPSHVVYIDNSSVTIPEKYYFLVKKNGITGKCVATRFISYSDWGKIIRPDHNNNNNGNTITNNVILNNTISNNTVTNTVGNNVVNNVVDDNNLKEKPISVREFRYFVVEVYADSTIKLYYEEPYSEDIEYRYIDTFKSNIPSDMIGKEDYGYGYNTNFDSDGNFQLTITIYNPEDKTFSPEKHFYDEYGNSI